LFNTTDENLMIIIS